MKVESNDCPGDATDNIAYKIVFVTRNMLALYQNKYCKTSVECKRRKCSE